MKAKLLEAAVAVAVVVGAVTLGTTIAARNVEAAPTRGLHWKCLATDRCGPGSNECCSDPTTDPKYTHCSTSCPIIIT